MIAECLSNMCVSNSTSSSNTLNVQDSTSKRQNAEASAIEFSLSDYANKDPKEISFEEYKNLTPEDIEKLYPKEEVPEQYEKAISLHTKANGTHDEILNEVLFDKEIVSDGSEFDKRVSHMIDFRIAHQEMIVRLELAMEKVDQYIKDNNIKFEGTDPKELGQQHLALVSKIEKELVVPEDRKIISKDEMFSVFKHNKIGAEASMEFNKYTPDDEQYQYYQAMISYEESIVADYEKRVAQKESQLSSHQSNQSAAYAIAQAQEEKDKKQVTQKAEQTTNTTSQIEESREDYYKRIQRLLEDVKSVMRTGLTVDELEQMQELIAKIQTLKAKDDPSNDGEIESLMKQLEEMLLQYQKRISGVVVIDSADDKGIKKEDETEVDTLDEKLDTIIQALEDIQSGRYKDKENEEENDSTNQMNSKDDLISKLRSEGYSEDEAKQRADIYKSAGLFSSYTRVGNIFDTELLGVSFTANPTYKKALMDAFERMDTDQLKSISSELRSRYEIDMEELKKRIPENLQVSDALLHGFDDYLGYQFGTPDQVFGMFDKMMEQASMLQRLTGEDQSEVIDGINKVINAYTQNLTL